MNQQPQPPKWAARFLAWFCDPRVRDEIEGDAYELYAERTEKYGKRLADVRFVWDVIRFFRPSNIRRTSGAPGFLTLFWTLNLKLAVRHSFRHKTLLSIKLSALTVCLAFTLLLSGFVVNELTYDHRYEDYERIYRVGCNVDFQGKQSNYAVSPLPMGPALADEIPMVESYSRFMIMGHPVFGVAEKKFYGITAYAADTNFLKMFPQRYLSGTAAALDLPNRIVLTEHVAARLFGHQEVVGKIVDLGWTQVEVGAVVRDLPRNTHFTFEVLISWNTFRREDEWSNINAYTYIKTIPDVNLAELDTAIAQTAGDYLQPMSDNYQFSFRPILQRLDEIHLSGFMDEDFAPKRSGNYIRIMISVIVLLLLSGVFNYLNLALAERTVQLKKIAVLRVFGGNEADHRAAALTDSFICLMMVLPLVAAIVYFVVTRTSFLPPLDASVWSHPGFLAIAGGNVLTILFSAALNGMLVSKPAAIISALKGVMATGQNRLPLRKILVGCQLAFSMVMMGLIVVIMDQVQYLRDSDKGFEPGNVLAVRRMGPQEKTIAWEETLRTMPGIRTVAGSSFYPEGGVETKDVFDIETSTGAKTLLTNFMFCEQGYPELLGMRLASGKFFGEEHKSAKKRYYMVNEAAVREYGWKDAVGKRIDFPVADGRQNGEVIGVVKDFHFESMYSKITPLILVLTNGEWGVNFFYVKIDPVKNAQAVNSLTRTWTKIFPDVPLEWQYLDAHYQSLYQNDYETRSIFRWGLLVSVVISVLGVFSISALMLTLRTREMGIRKVVGAGGMHLFFLYLKPFSTFLLAAVTVGFPLVFYLAQRWLSNFAYHIGLNAAYFLVPVAAVVVIILLAAGYHAVLCANVNPVKAIKTE